MATIVIYGGMGVEFQVSYPMPLGRDLGLDSTATPHTGEGVRLWLRGPTHQGRLPRSPSWPSLAGPGAFASSHFSRRSDRHGGDNGRSDSRRAGPCRVDSRGSYAHTSDRIGCYSENVSYFL